MAGKAIVSPQLILASDIDENGDFLTTFTAHYTLPGVSEELKDVTANCGWPGLTSTAFHQALADAVIDAQPDGYSMARADIIVPVFAKASVI